MEEVQNRRRLRAPLAIVALLFALFGSAQAFPITIDPGAYTGFYRTTGAGLVRGVNVIDLGAGFHTVGVDDNTGFLVDVDASGNVTSLNPTAASTSGSTIIFNTVPVTVDPGAFTGKYRFGFPDQTIAAGPRTVFVLPNLNGYILGVDDNTGFRFNVDAAGNVTSLNPTAASTSGSTIIFNTVPVTVDPGAFTGKYRFGFPDQTIAAGPRTVFVLPNLTGYILGVDDNAGFRFDVDASGNVTSRNPAAATSNGSTLTFSTTTIHIDPQTYAGFYSVGLFNPTDRQGESSIELLFGIANYFLIIPNKSVGRFSIDVNGDPNPVSIPMSDGVATHDFLLSAFTLTMVDIDIKPSGGGNEVEPNEAPDPWNPNSKGKVPVAVLTSEVFDAADVDVSTVRFGKTGTEASSVRDTLEDVDGDGDIDLLLKFEVQDAGLECLDPLATLTGRTIFGADFEGTEPIRTVGCD